MGQTKPVFGWGEEGDCRENIVAASRRLGFRSVGVRGRETGAQRGGSTRAQVKGLRLMRPRRSVALQFKALPNRRVIWGEFV